LELGFLELLPITVCGKLKNKIVFQKDNCPNIEPQIQFLYKCIAELPEIDRIIISLELEEIKQAEIASIVGLSEANIRVKIHRIKEKLTQKFTSNER
jgi:RNA polymerase sigma-70 factor (ECF subfamily)